MINYKKLMDLNPTEYSTLTNSKRQEIVFYKYSLQGDEAEVIRTCHELKLADNSGFFDLIDMEAEHKKYDLSFQDGRLYIGEFLNN